MRNFLARLWLSRQASPRLDEKKKDDARKILAGPPVREYLVALMKELVQEGIYLPPEKQEGAKFAIEILKGEIAKGDKLFRKEDK